MSRRIASIVMVGLIALSSSVPAVAEENVYKKGVKSTVWIVQPAGSNRLRTGSGALIDAQKRLVLTNYHVVGTQKEAIVFFPAFDPKGNLIPEREKYMEALRAGQGIKAKVLFAESGRDLAIIQLDSLPRGVQALRLAKESPSPGDRVHSIGSPGVSGALFNYTDGSVKSVYKKQIRFTAGPDDPAGGFVLDARVIETSSSTNKGDSGGPLLNDKCELVGVTQSILTGRDEVTRPVSIFVDLSEVRNILKERKITLTTPAASASESTASTAKPMNPMTTTDMPPANPAAEKRKKEAEASAKLSGARLVANTNKKQGRQLLEELIEQYPGTEAATEAKKLLDKLK